MLSSWSLRAKKLIIWTFTFTILTQVLSVSFHFHKKWICKYWIMRKGGWVEYMWNYNWPFCYTLTLYHTIPALNNQEKVAFWKHCGGRRKCWFLQSFLTIPKANFSFCVTFMLLPANAFNLVESQILLFS